MYKIIKSLILIYLSLANVAYAAQEGDCGPNNKVVSVIISSSEFDVYPSTRGSHDNMIFLEIDPATSLCKSRGMYGTIVDAAYAHIDLSDPAAASMLTVLTQHMKPRKGYTATLSFAVDTSDELEALAVGNGSTIYSYRITSLELITHEILPSDTN